MAFMNRLDATTVRSFCGHFAPDLQKGDPKYAMAAAAIVVASLIAKLWLIFSGTVRVSATDGATRLFVAMDRFGDASYFSDIGTWSGVPMPVPQAYYMVVYWLDRVTDGAIATDTTLLAINAIAYAAAAFLLARLTQKLADGPAGLICALLCVSAFTPNYTSLTVAVEPLGIMFFTVCAYCVFTASQSAQPYRRLFIGAAAFALATAFRLEYYLLAPFFAVIVCARHGIAQTVLFLLAALSHVAFYRFVQFIDVDALSYAEIRSVYSVIQPRSFSELLQSSLFQRGVVLTWGLPALILSSFAIIWGLMRRQYRLLCLTAGSAIAMVLLAAIAGRIAAGNARYVALGMFLLGLPFAAYLSFWSGQLAAILKRNRKTVDAFLLTLIATLSIMHASFGMDARTKRPDAQSREIRDWLLEQSATPTSTFFDMAATQEFPLAIPVALKTGRPAYTYLSRCCVSDAARRILGDARVEELTGDRGILRPRLSPLEKAEGQRIWAHGFIETYRPKYMVALRPGKRNLLEAALPSREYVSNFLGYMTKADEYGVSVVNLRYADVEMSVRPVFFNNMFMIYEAEYGALAGLK